MHPVATEKCAGRNHSSLQYYRQPTFWQHMQTRRWLNKHGEIIFPCNSPGESHILGGMWNIWIFKSCHFLSSGNIPQDRFLTRELNGVIWKERWKKTYKDFTLDLYKLSPPAIRFNISRLFNWFGKFKANIKWNLIRGPLWECPLKKSLPTTQIRYSTEKQHQAQLEHEKHLSHGIAKVLFQLNQQNCFYILHH